MISSYNFILYYDFFFVCADCIGIRREVSKSFIHLTDLFKINKLPIFMSE